MELDVYPTTNSTFRVSIREVDVARLSINPTKPKYVVAEFVLNSAPTSRQPTVVFKGDTFKHAVDAIVDIVLRRSKDGLL